jgi:hypothetical protein
MIVGVSFKYHTNYDYDANRDCSAHGCDEEGICRCETLENAHVVTVDIPSIGNEIYNSIFDNSLSSKRNSAINSILGGVSKEIDIYTIDRILRINKAYEPSNWEVQVCGGYYGQEIDDVLLENSVAQKIEDQINEALSIIDLTSRIVFGSDEHYRKVNTKSLDHYSDKNYTGIRGIALVKDDKFRLIDGYHRSSTSENIKIQLLIAR